MLDSRRPKGTRFEWGGGEGPKHTTLGYLVPVHGKRSTNYPLRSRQRSMYFHPPRVCSGPVKVRVRSKVPMANHGPPFLGPAQPSDWVVYPEDQQLGLERQSALACTPTSSDPCISARRHMIVAQILDVFSLPKGLRCRRSGSLGELCCVDLENHGFGLLVQSTQRSLVSLHLAFG